MQWEDWREERRSSHDINYSPYSVPLDPAGRMTPDNRPGICTVNTTIDLVRRMTSAVAPTCTRLEQAGPLSLVEIVCSDWLALL